jgi:hypothetical protein
MSAKETGTVAEKERFGWIEKLDGKHNYFKFTKAYF